MAGATGGLRTVGNPPRARTRSCRNRRTPDGRRAARRAHAAAHPRRVRRPGAPARAGQGAARADREGRPRQRHLLGTARHRKDDARPDHRRTDGRRLRALQCGDGRHCAGARDRGEARERRAPRSPDHPVLRRDPPLQQGAAGRLPASRRGRHHHAHRCDDGEPVVRGDRRAAQPLASLRAGAALAAGAAGHRAPRDGRRRARTRQHGADVDDDALELIAARGRRRRAARAQHARGRRHARRRWRHHHGRALPARRCSCVSRATTRAARSTSTSCRRTTSRCAAATRRRAVLDGAHDRGRAGPLIIFRRAIAMAAEDIGMADPYALQLAVAAREAFRVLGPPEGCCPSPR
jgi:hypothetical protein